MLGIVTASTEVQYRNEYLLYSYAMRGFYKQILIASSTAWLLSVSDEVESLSMGSHYR